MINFATIDIECDGCHSSINQQLFPQAPHWDVESIPWCFTITKPIDKRWSDYYTTTYVCKLPPKPRYIGELNGNPIWGNYHEVETVIPESLIVNGKPRKIIACSNMHEFLDHIDGELNYIEQEYYYSKCYGNWNFDFFILNEINTKLCLGFELGYISNYSPLTWKSTSSQVKPGTFISNQEFMNKGIIHNIEDSEQLFLKVLNME